MEVHHGHPPWCEGQAAQSENTAGGRAGCLEGRALAVEELCDGLTGGVKTGAGREVAGGDTEGPQDEPNVKKMKSRLRVGATPTRNRKG
jgi:hypothetical protein